MEQRLHCNPVNSWIAIAYSVCTKAEFLPEPSDGKFNLDQVWTTIESTICCPGLCDALGKQVILGDLDLVVLTRVPTRVIKTLCTAAALGAALSARRRTKRDRNVSKLGFCQIEIGFFKLLHQPNKLPREDWIDGFPTQFRISRFDWKIAHPKPISASETAILHLSPYRNSAVHLFQILKD